mgnify:CR=1 FL=1
MKLHQPVLLNETIELLDLKSGQIVVDMSAGYGGHADEILKHIGETGSLVLIDRDIEAIKALREKFKSNKNVAYIHSNFAEIDWDKIGKADRVLMDLGVSSPQLDEAERGFSFRFDGPLDMRMDPSRGSTLADKLDRKSVG